MQIYNTINSRRYKNCIIAQASDMSCWLLKEIGVAGITQFLTLKAAKDYARRLEKFRAADYPQRSTFPPPARPVSPAKRGPGAAGTTGGG